MTRTDCSLYARGDSERENAPFYRKRRLPGRTSVISYAYRFTSDPSGKLNEVPVPESGATLA